MRFKDYIKEQYRNNGEPTFPWDDDEETISTPNFQNMRRVEEHEVKEWIKKNASRYIQKLKDGSASPIYRGFTAEAPYLIGDSRSLKRRAAYTANYINLLVSNDAAWKRFPPRSSSYICTTNEHKAEQYGDLALIIPADSAQIGICTESDFWDSFSFLKRRHKNVDSINTMLEFIKEEMNLKLDEQKMTFDEMRRVLSDVTTEKLHDFVNQLEGFDNDHPDHTRDYNQRWAKIIRETILQSPNMGDSLYEWLSKSMDPYTNKFQVLNGREFDIHGDHEVWVHGEVAVIGHADNPLDWVEELE
jgi:hypothetical protein